MQAVLQPDLRAREYHWQTLKGKSLPALSAFLGTHSTDSSTDSLTMFLYMQLLSYGVLHSSG